MSRVAKWKLEKAKIKVVFRLQFHATHIPQAGWDKLFISFIPADTGKATAKTTKTNVRNGACKWADPIYETTRLLQDSKSKQYDEKLYKFVVAMGSSRSSILGEATINLADYADALKPSIVALPLQGCNSGTILHVTVQLLTSKTGFREFEQQRELRERGLQTGADMSRHDVFCAGKVSSSEEVNARVKFRPESKELPSLEEEAGLTEEYADSAIGLDGSSNTSESLYAEKHDVSSAHEIESQKSTVSGDLTVIPNCQSPVEEKKDISDGRILAQGSSDWVHGWSSDFSMDNDLAIAYEENNRLRGSLDVAESSVLGLKLEISSLQSLADEIGVGTQKFAQQLADETASGEKLAKEVSIMRAECSKLKGDMEQLKSLKLSTQYANKVTSSINGGDLFQGIQLRLLNGLFVLEDKIRDLQNKMYLGFHDRDLRLLYTDLEALLIVLQELKQGAQEANSLVNLPSEMINVQESREVSSHGNEQLMAGQGLDVDLYQPPDMLHCLSIPNMVSQGSDSLGAMEAMKGQIFELLRELDEAKGERESLTRKMDQMECYYEALVQELEENQKQMLGELQNLRNEHSTCMYTIATKTAEIESMRQDMSEQILRFTEERCELESINKELERRAVTSEASLRRARLNYSIAVDQLQKDLDLLSFQVLSMFETNENLIKQTFSEPSQLCLQGPQDAVRNLEESDASKLRQFQNQNAEVNKQVMGGDILLEDMKKSLLLQEGLYQKIEEELSEMQVVNLSLDVFSKILQEILLEASLGIIQMEKKTDELEQQLDLAIESKKLFGLQLQTAMDEIQTLNEYKAGCVAKCSDMALQNQTLEAKLVGLSNENVLLMQKTTEQEALLIECRSYESKYQVCSSEKMELTDLLKQETSNRSNLQNEIFSLKEELKAIKAECGELASSKENLQEIVGLVDDKLRSLLVSYNEQLNGLYPLTSSLHRDTSNLKSVLSQLEEIQHNACEKILQLLEEKKNLVDERDLAQSSSSTANAEILVAKQKFKHDIQSMAANLEASNTLLAKLQLELETLTSKLYNCSEAEERYTQRNEELSADLTVLEVELQQLTSKNMDLAKEILSLDTINIELERSKLTIADLAEERQNLLTSLQDKSHESITLASELDSLKESMRFLHDELQVERSLRENLESHVSDLTSQLNEKHDHLLRFSNQEAELLHFRQLASDLELEKSQISHILLQHEECLGKLRDESSCLTDLENQLSEMHKHVVAADVKVVFFGMEYETRMEEVGLKLQSSQRDLFELHRKLSDVEVMLNHSLAGEAHYVEENVNLQKSIESLRLELEASVAQQGVLSDLNHHMALQMEEYEKRIAELELNFSNDKTEHSVEVEQLKHKLMLYVEEIDDHIFSKEELEITLVVLKAKLDELHVHNTLLRKYNEEILMLQEHCKELTRKLSEQILKTEEFKNLSIHLKELKDKAEAESVHVHEKREPEGPQVAVQESLRIAFIKEQCETKVQELKQQLSISQKHGEELLWKLQDAVDELENRKKSEASHLKRNEELSLKILELEADLQSVVSEKREKIKAYDCIKTELECAQLSFECCKEEKQRLEASLLECSEENNRVATELILIKGQLESSVSPMYIHKEESNGSDDLGYISGDTVIRQACKDYTVQDPSIKESITTDVAENGSTERSLECSTQQILVNCEEIQDTCSSPIVDTERQTRSVNVQPSKDALVPKSMHAGTKHAFVEQGTLRHNDLKQLSVINDHFRNQSLRSTMDHLHKELERMKNENSLLTMDDLHIDPNFQGLQTELMQLNKANEELRSIFPLFDEIPDSGNALERVLALEIELAEALRAKKKSSGLFQSSFLKQHSDEQAILQSFRNINELIKEMLELKGRHAAVETELKGMHARYSQLSLRFAEVEGERQKLTMTLKNVRSMSKKPMQSSDSSPATPGDY